MNSRIRKRWRQGNLLVGLIGEEADLGYEYAHIGDGPGAIAKLAAPEGKERLLIVVGQGAIARPDGAAILGAAAKAALAHGVVKDGWNGFSVLHTAASRVGGLDIGFVPGKGGKTALEMAAGGVDVLFNLGADEIEIAEGPSLSTRAATATWVHIVPTSSSPAPPTPKRARPTSTPKAACK